MTTVTVQLKTKFDLPPEQLRSGKSAKAGGIFQVVHAHFSNRKIQDGVDSLSMRSQGTPKLATDSIPSSAPSDLGVTFQLDGGYVSFF